jgi:predicted membrane protein
MHWTLVLASYGHYKVSLEQFHYVLIIWGKCLSTIGFIGFYMPYLTWFLSPLIGLLSRIGTKTSLFCMFARG